MRAFITGSTRWLDQRKKRSARLGDTAAIEHTNIKGTMELAQAVHANGRSKNDLYEFSQRLRIAV